MHKLYIADLDTDKLIPAVRGVRAALVALAYDQRATLKEARHMLDQFVESRLPVLVGEAEGLDLVEAAAAKLEAESAGAVRAGIDLPADELERAIPEQPIELPEWPSAAYRAALVLLLASQGNHLVAYTQSALLFNALRDPLYEDVCSIFSDLFPMPEDDDDEPLVTIIRGG